MINYIKSEFYRSVRNRTLIIITTVFLLLLIAVDLVLAQFVNDSTFPYATTKFALSNIYAQMQLFLLFTSILANTYYWTEDKDHTIKHSISFGINRGSVFFGRFLLQSVMFTVIFTVLCCCYAGLTYLLLNHSNAGEFELLFRFSYASLPSLLWVVALSQTLSLLMNNSGMVMTILISFVFIIPMIINLLGRKIQFFYIIGEWIPYNLIAHDGPISIGGAELWKPIVVGLIWLIVTLGIGYKLFKRKEIK